MKDRVLICFDCRLESLTMAISSFCVPGYIATMAGYVRHTINAIYSIIEKYPSLNFHRRLALIVPNKIFLHQFQRILTDGLQKAFHTRPFVLKSCEESLCFLPHYFCPSAGAETSEVLILDEIANLGGLEYLFVVSIGLDEKIEETEKDGVPLVERMPISLLQPQGCPQEAVFSQTAPTVNQFLAFQWFQVFWLKFMGSFNQHPYAPYGRKHTYTT